MRIGKRGFQARVKADLHIEYGDENLTSVSVRVNAPRRWRASVVAGRAQAS